MVMRVGHRTWALPATIAGAKIRLKAPGQPWDEHQTDTSATPADPAPSVSPGKALIPSRF